MVARVDRAPACYDGVLPAERGGRGGLFLIPHRNNPLSEREFRVPPVHHHSSSLNSPNPSNNTIRARHTLLNILGILEEGPSP